MLELLELSDEDRELAMSRFLVLQQHLEQDRQAASCCSGGSGFGVSNGSTLGGTVPSLRFGSTGTEA